MLINKFSIRKQNNKALLVKLCFLCVLPTKAKGASPFFTTNDYLQTVFAFVCREDVFSMWINFFLISKVLISQKIFISCYCLKSKSSAKTNRQIQPGFGLSCGSFVIHDFYQFDKSWKLTLNSTDKIFPLSQEINGSYKTANLQLFEFLITTPLLSWQIIECNYCRWWVSF